MSDDDLDKTLIIRPSPGRRSAAPERTEPLRDPRPPSPEPSAPPPPVASAAVLGFHSNPMVQAARSLFALVTQLRETTSHEDLGGLRNHVVEEMRAFETASRAAGVGNEAVLAARYALCTLLDEVVLSTPWGSGSVWSAQSVLSIFHGETGGGEKFFTLLDRGLQSPSRNLELLELMYLCLILGLEGKYMILDRGRSQLEEVRDNLYRTIRGQRGDFERDLSPHWRGMAKGSRKLTQYFPLWVVAAFTSVMLLALYSAFSYTLSGVTFPVIQDLRAIGMKPPAPAPTPSPSQPAPEPVDMALFLEEEILAGLVEVTEEAGRTVIRIIGDGLFASGSDQLMDVRLPVLQRIATALTAVSGQILVTGHTDNVPMRGKRFPSNWHLSRARALSVVRILVVGGVPASRLTSDGRAELEPLAPNNTPEGRARNRRVDITLMAKVNTPSAPNTINTTNTTNINVLPEVDLP